MLKRLGKGNGEDRKETRFWQSKGVMLLLIFFIFILILTFFFGDRGILDVVRARRTIERLKGEIEALEREKAALSEEVRQLQENPLSLEKQAREKLWLMKPNEKVVVIVPEDKEASPQK